jgi:hypothetical protein
LETVHQRGVKVWGQREIIQRVILYWNIANVQPKQTAKHLRFRLIEVFRPSLMAPLVGPAIATISKIQAAGLWILDNDGCTAMHGQGELVRRLLYPDLALYPHTSALHSASIVGFHKK